MADCEFVEKCPIFEKSKTGIIKAAFGTKYCKGSSMEECARRKLKHAGQEVPEKLLPNGEYMS
jgi:hypothetical protein